jgi:hypothetical protein
VQEFISFATNVNWCDATFLRQENERMIMRRALPLAFVVIASLAGSCGDDDTFEPFDGEYQFGFPNDTDAASLAAVADKCGQGSGVESSRVDTNAADGSPLVIVEFDDGSLEDQERVALCARGEGSNSQLVP